MDKHTKKHCSANIQEICKEIHIKDIYNNPKYKIILQKEKEYSFLVFVFQINFDGKSIEILRRRLNRFDRAENFFRKCVEDYSMLEKACHRLPQRIDEFAESIGYRDVKPPCCATCKFSRPDSGHEFLYGHGQCGKLICSNGEIFHPGFAGVSVRPVVDPMGVCNSYEPKPLDIDLNFRKHGAWTWEHHDCCPGNIHETAVKFEIDRRLRRFEEKIENTLSGKVQTIVETQVSPIIQQDVENIVAEVVPPQIQEKMQETVQEVVQPAICEEIEKRLPDAIISSLSGEMACQIIDKRVLDIADSEIQHKIESADLVCRTDISDFVCHSELELSVPVMVSSIVEERLEDMGTVSGNKDVEDYNDDGVVDERDRQHLIDFLMNGGGA